MKRKSSFSCGRSAICRSTIAGTVLASALLASGAMVAPSLAQAQENEGYDWKLFLGGSFVSPLSDDSIPGLANTIEASDEFGYELGIEWKMSDRLGFEVAYFDVDQDIEADGTRLGEIGFSPWNFSLNFHIVNRNIFDWYVGPTVSYINWDDIEIDPSFGGGSVDIDSETSYGVSTGFTIGLGETFAIQFGLRYIDATIEDSQSSDNVSVDPLFTGVAVAFRF
jgi:outer membrane protein W